MARHAGPRTVQCYLCRHRFEVGGRAQSTSCPHCYKPVIVADVIVEGHKPVTEVRTCGHVIVKKKGRVVAKLIEAHLGIECDGVVDAQKIISGGPVVLSKRAQWKGSLRAPALIIAEGARIGGGFFDIPNDDLKLTELLPKE
jgi:hypothetical protein